MSKWEMVRLKDIASYNKGKQINGDMLIDTARYDYLNGGKKPSGKWIEFNTPENTITISEGGNSSGYVNYIVKPFWCGAHCYYLYELKCNSKYLYHTLKANQNKLMALRSGACMPNIKKSDLGEFSFTYTNDKAEQKKIADELDKISGLITKRKSQIEKLDLLVKAKFIEMFGDPVANPMGWEKKKLKSIAKIITGNTPPRNDTENYGDFIEWIKTDNITTNMHITLAREYLSEKGAKIGRIVPSNSILMACIAGSIRSIGRVAISDRPVSFNQQINAVIPKNCNLYFLYHMFKLNDKYIQSTINMSLKGILSKGKLESLLFVCPPLTLQTKFADFVTNAEKQKESMKTALLKLEMLYNARMQEYFE